MTSILGKILVLAALLLLLATACSGAEEPSRLGIEVDRVEFRDEIGRATPEGVFVTVRLALRNITDSPLNLYASNFILIDEDGNEHEESMEGLRAYRGKILDGFGLDPGRKIDVLTIFDIPPTGNQRRLAIQFRHEPPVEFDAIPGSR